MTPWQVFVNNAAKSDSIRKCGLVPVTYPKGVLQSLIDINTTSGLARKPTTERALFAAG
jgi:hypothetical protein